MWPRNSLTPSYRWPLLLLYVYHDDLFHLVISSVELEIYHESQSATLMLEKADVTFYILFSFKIYFLILYLYKNY